MGLSKQKFIIYVRCSCFALIRITVCFFLVFSVPVNGNGETIEQVFREVVEVDWQLKASEQRLTAVEEELLAAKALRYPTLSGEASYTFLDNTPSTSFSLLPVLPSQTIPLLEEDRFFMSSITVSLPVFTSFRIIRAVKAAEATVSAERSVHEQTVQDIKLKLAETYVNVLRAERNIDVAKSNVTALSAHARDVENFFDQGLVPKNDVLAVQVALADARQTEIRAANALDLARSAYNRQLGRPLDNDVNLEDLAVETYENKQDAEVMIKRALENRPEIRQLSDQAIALSFKAGSIRSSALPQVLLYGSFHHLTNTSLNDENIWSGTVAVRWDLFDGGVTRHKARSEERKKAVVESMRRDVESMVRLQVRQVLLDVSETAERIEVTREALNQSEENLRIAKNRYAREIGSNAEVLDAETLRIKSITNHVNALYDRIMAEFRLKRSTGDL